MTYYQRFLVSLWPLEEPWHMERTRYSEWGPNVDYVTSFRMAL